MKHTGTKSWDRAFFLLCAPLALFVMPLVAGYDLGHTAAPRIPVIYSVMGCLVYLSAAFFMQWATYVNKHFEVTVRIQDDRGHRVVSSGPYRIIRHPGYSAAITLYLLMPVIVGSYYALIPAGLITALFIVRTALEDATLSNELAGYTAYANRVKFRLVPGIW
ncbi:MAG: isoprenylcysteine carboxylmethyltransferase family protein [Candidatus Omnitrophota bacterium]